MTISVKAVKFDLEEKSKDFVNKKVERIRYAEDLIVDVLISLKREKAYTADATVNFRWGASAHVSANDFELEVAVNKMMDMLDLKVRKEKDKIQDR